eukprot:8106674-Ditylum_brightwellii.AAC.1
MLFGDAEEAQHPVLAQKQSQLKCSSGQVSTSAVHPVRCIVCPQISSCIGSHAQHISRRQSGATHDLGFHPCDHQQWHKASQAWCSIPRL